MPEQPMFSHAGATALFSHAVFSHGAPVPPPGFEPAVLAEAAGEATPEQVELLGAHPDMWRRTVEELLTEVEESLRSVKALDSDDRDQVVADFEEERLELARTLARLGGPPLEELIEAPGEVRLQASWAAGKIVVWAGGKGAGVADGEELADRLEAAGAPAEGWDVHPAVTLPTGERADALSIPVGDGLGWLVAVGAGQGVEHVGASVAWLGRIAVWGVQLLARGQATPTLRTKRSAERGDRVNAHVQWVPALVDRQRLADLARVMPGPVTAVEQNRPELIVTSALEAIVDAVATDAAKRLDLPAPPPGPRTPAGVAESVLTRLDGSTFQAPARLCAQVANGLLQWAQPLTDPSSGKLVVQLDPPDSGGAWFLSVLGPDPDGRLVPVEVAVVDSRSKRLAAELARLERMLPVLLRPGGRRRGEVILDQAEAWDLMAEKGPVLEAAGFDVRVPALSRKKPTPSLRLTSEATETKVGAHQLANVRWSAVFDDVELTAADIARLAREARPLVRSHGQWVALDKADLLEAQAALAERADRTQLTGAEMLREALGLEGSPLRGGITVEGSGWAAELLAKASALPATSIPDPEGFEGTLRSYQADALAWLGFLDSAGLGGCLALDMGLGKTPTVLAHLASTQGDGRTALVIAPPAVVGNWAAEAARFTPGLRVVVHHGASRASAAELASEVAGADLVITTYGTAVRDVDALAAVAWEHVVLDEAQAIKNPASETAQLLRRIPATVRLALTGTPVENGLGDLWAILDFANPGLLGARAHFIAQLSPTSGTARQGGEQALRALNGILTFRRTKSEPSVAAELPDRIDQLDHCTMTTEQIGLYQAVLDRLVADSATADRERRQGDILAAITALKQICNHPVNYQDDGGPIHGRSGKLARLEEIVDSVFASGEKVLVFTHFAEWGKKLATHLTERTGTRVECYHGGLARGARDKLVADFQGAEGAGCLVLSLKAGGTGLNLTAASHVVLYDRWWNPAVEDQARDRAWRIGQTRTVVSHRLVCPGTIDERVEEVVAGKRHIADVVLPKASSLADLDVEQLRVALGVRSDALLLEDAPDSGGRDDDPPDAEGDEEAA